MCEFASGRGLCMWEERNQLAALTRKLDAMAKLGKAELEAIQALPYRLEDVAAARHLVREGTAPADCCVLIRGYACRYKLTASGARQIVSFHIAGDILDLQHIHLQTADHHVQAVTSARVAWISKAQFRSLALQWPQIAEAMWRDSLIDASIFREWVLNVGRRDAKSRIAHMLCEFLMRCETAGLVNRKVFELPLTQEHIADATGLTSVHVNRMLKLLTSEGALEGGSRSYRVASWERLKAIGEFDQAYLHAAA